MGANKTVYTLDLDTSRLINNYKAALKEMKNAGVATDITKGLEDQLKKLETEYNVLANAGKAGFTNTTQITNFNKRVEKLMTSFRGFETELGGVSGKIREVAQNAQKAGQKLQNAFSRVGFKDAAQQMQAVLSATDREAKLTEVVNEELKKRAQAVAQLKAEYEAAAQAAQVANTRISADALSSNATAKINGKSVWTSGKNKPDEATRQAVVAQAQAIAQAASSGQQAWQKFCDYLKSNGLDKIFNKQALPGVEDTIKAMQANYANAAPLIEQAHQAQQRFNEAQANFNQIGKNNNGTLTLNRGVLSGLTRELNNFNNVEERSLQVVNSNIISAERLASAEQTVSNAARNAAGSAALEEGSISNLTAGLMETAQAAERTSKTFEQIKTRIAMFFSVTTMFNALRNQIRKTYNDVKQLDKSFASIAMVTKYSVNDMWKSYSQYAEMAGRLGQKTDDVVKASALFYQQGLDTNESLALTADTMKLATIAGNDYQTATKEMTSALRGFKMEMDEGAHVTDVYSELAAHAAARVDDIAQAMARTASIANSAGMSFENTSAFLTQMIETTQESAENIGTSLKTIIARFTELKNNVAGTSESEFSDLEYNKVDKALKSVGVELKDVNGQFRNLDDVFLELSKKWDTLDRNTQRYVATIAAGSRQQSRFIAMMDNYERTAELIDYAADAEGKADEQFAKYADTMEYKLNQLSTTWEEFRVRLMDSDLFKGAIDGLTTFVSRINAIDFSDKFNVAKMAIGVPVIISSIKNIAKTITASMQSTIGSMRKIGQDIGRTLRNNIVRSIGKPTIDIQFKDQVLKTRIKDLKKKIQDEYNLDPVSVDILTQIDAAGAKTNEQILDEFKQKLKALGYTEGETAQMTEKLDHALKYMGASSDGSGREVRLLTQDVDALSISSEKARQSTERLQKQQTMSRSLTSLVSVTVSSMATAMAGWVNGITDFGTAMKTVGASIAFTTLQLGTQIAMERVSLALSHTLEKRKEIEAARIAGANELEEVSFWKVFVAENAVLGPIMIGIAALAALAVAIAGIIHLTKVFIRESDEQARAFERVAEAEKELKDLEQSRNEIRSENSTTQKELKDAKELKEKYEELTSIVNKTVEEEEEYKEVISTILDTIPEIVTHYDEMNNELVISNDLWDLILEKQQKAAKQSALSSLGADVAYINGEKAVIEATQNALATVQDPYTLLKKSGHLTERDLKTWSIAMGEENLTTARVKELNEIFERVYTQQATDKEYAMFNAFTTKYKSLIKDQEEDLKDLQKEQLAAYQDYFKNIGYESGVALLLSQKALNQEVLKEQEYDYKDMTGFSNKVGGNYAGGPWGYEHAAFNNFIKWDKLGADSPEIQKALIAALGDEEKAKDFYEKNRKHNQNEIWEKYKTGASLLNLESFADMQDIDEQIVKEFNEFYGDLQNKNLKEIQGYINKVQDEDLKKILQEQGTDTLTNIIGDISTDNSIANILGFYNEKDYEKWSIQSAQSYKTAMEDFLKNAGKEEAKAQLYLQKVNKTFIEKGLTPEEQTAFLQSIDWSEANVLNWDSFREKNIKNIEETFKFSSIEARNFFDELSGLIEGTDLLKTDIVNGAQVKDYIEKIQKIANIFVSNGDALSSYLNNTQDSVKLTIGEYQNLQKVFKDLKEAGASGVDELTKYDEASGKWILNTAKLKTLMNENSEKVIEQLRNAKKLNEERLKEIKNELESKDIDEEKKTELESEQELLKSANETIQEEITSQKNLNAQVQKTCNLLKTAEGIIKSTSGYVDGFSKALSSFGSDGFMSSDSISALNEALKSMGKSATDYIGKNLALDTGKLYSDILADLDKQFTNPDFLKDATEEEKLQLVALRRELITTYDEYLTKLEEEGDKVTKAIKEKEKADKAYADQLEDVTEKQEKLNEALKEYNELLNGSDNRKSSLDYLYNYDEAITSFNDEISRSKDLMADSKTIQDSAAALTRYAQATHNLIAEETAKQDVIKQGLANYANMIENGSYSYTNRETGATTNINFGNYAKKDSRTGKYIIDQRLLNESKFADKWKDQLEEQVSMYNKYADELLKSEDNVRKAEKEIRDERNAALKKYVSMEKEIADALKAAYQEEVDQLKNKYDSMKDADDDYIDALQKAIEKQRKLRKQEQGFEDLAKKEKRLSLMSRDTSGANAIETRKLEEEIKKDRESLLDEAIDNVVDELSKLYESQEKLREEEMELKEALLDNTLYWNSQAEALAGSFESGEEYAQYLSSLSKEYAEMTLAMQQDKLNEYGQTYTEATEYMAMVAMDTTSETGDFIVDTLIVTGEEVSNIVAETAESFTTEVVRSYNETTAAFVADMQKAEEAIDSANKALQEAYEKLNECAQAANKAAEEVAKAYAAASGTDAPVFGEINDPYGGTRANPAQIAQANYENAQVQVEIASATTSAMKTLAIDTLRQKGVVDIGKHGAWLRNERQRQEVADQLKSEGYFVGTVNDTMRAFKSDAELGKWLSANAQSSPVKRYLNGGLADYTGYAFVDGTPEEPEGFLTAEQTQAIGDAAKIFSDIPWLDHSSSNTSVVTNNGGDVSVEINLNIDHISSETDIDEMIQRVKDEIVDVARPEGTNVILQQQLN